jgi:hypothetical protein
MVILAATLNHPANPQNISVACRHCGFRSKCERSWQADCFLTLVNFEPDCLPEWCALKMKKAAVLLSSVALFACLPSSAAERKKPEMAAQDKTEAVERLQKAAAHGDAEAQGRLGFMYLNGKNVPPDAAKAFQWLQKSAVQGNPHAQYNLGTMYSSGMPACK